MKKLSTSEMREVRGGMKGRMGLLRSEEAKEIDGGNPAVNDMIRDELGGERGIGPVAREIARGRRGLVPEMPTPE